MTLVEYETEVRSVRRPQKSLGIVGGGGNYPGRRLAQNSVFPRSRRLHYVSTNWGVFGGLATTSADWIGGGKRRCDNDL
jgi:uridylate kinase